MPGTRKTASGTAAAKKPATKKSATKKPVEKKKTTTSPSDKKGAAAIKEKKMSLVIVESPAKAHTITKFLGEGFVVRASNGHVRDLPKSTLGVDIDNNFEPKYITIRGKSDVLDKLKTDAKNANMIYLATDPDREGEAISWHLAQFLNIPEEKQCRIEFNEITRDKVRSAIKSPRMINMNLVDAQQARRVLDRLVGYKLSPILWRKVRTGLSAGRVQSVATRLVVEREREVENFIPKEYWLLTAGLTEPQSKAQFDARFHGTKTEKMPLNNQEETQKVVEAVQNAAFEITKSAEGQRKRHAPAPFTTSMLQQEASRRLGFTTKKTAMLAQMLYEGIELKGSGTVGLITYMRTDSVRVSAEAQQATLGFIRTRFGDDFAPETPNFYRGRQRAQDAHEAIRPTSITREPAALKESLTNDQYKLYKLIYDRFLASQMSEAVYRTVSADISADKYLFKYNGSVLIFPGFLRAISEPEEEDQTDKLPSLTVGMPLILRQLRPEQKFTEPPSRFTEGTLVKELEEKGIGRPSTYAPTISTIIDRGYIVRESKTLRPTELGEIVTDLMIEHFPAIVDVSFTAGMEDMLDSIEDEGKDWHKIIKDFYDPFEQTVQKADTAIERVVIPDVVSDVPCEKCGAMMVYKHGRFGKFLACPNFPNCRNTKPIVEDIGVPCPKCGAPITARKSKKTRKNFYGCTRFPECDFISSLKPVAEKCPQCGGYMVASGKGAMCANKECGYKTTQGKKNG